MYVRDILIDLHLDWKLFLAMIYVPTDSECHPLALLGLYSGKFYLKKEEVKVGSKCLLALNYIEYLLYLFPDKHRIRQAPGRMGWFPDSTTGGTSETHDESHSGPVVTF